MHCRAVVCALIACTLLPSRTSAYSVLAHEACVDAAWDAGIRPLLVQRYPRTNEEALLDARAYAYGGSVIQDLGYYPFGSHFFTNLLHYVRSGDFVEALIRDAHDVNDLAFALGALAHYETDNIGHPEGVNTSVPLMFPKLRAKYGDRVTYVESPASHIVVEFSFDIVQVAAGAYLSQAYHRFIGFRVATPLVERAFRETYGLEVKDVLHDEDLAIATYRKSVSELIPELTRAAWRDKKEEIAHLTPDVTQDAFVFRYTRQEYEQEFGARYQKPAWYVRVIAFFYRLVPKIGPLKPLKFKTPTPQAEAFFETSFKDSRARYMSALADARRGTLSLANTNFDVGAPSPHGTYPLADDTYAELLERLEQRQYATVPAPLRRSILTFYARRSNAPLDRKERKRADRIRQQL